MLQGREELAIGHHRRAASAQDDDVDTRKLVAAQPEAFPSDALQPITVDGAASAFLRDRKTESRGFQAVRPIENDESGSSRSERLAEDPAELTRVGKPRAAREAAIGAVSCLRGDQQGARRARPFARRAARTFRPLRVALRARKPWVRARFRRLG